MIKVRVPASSANIGPGFDCLGLALSVYNVFSFEKIDGSNQYIGFDPNYCNDNNLVYTSMLRAFKEINYKLDTGIKIKCEQNIPLSRGLGSSASCIVAGITAANSFANFPLSKKDILDIASEIEGHPDNVAPVIFGGLTVAIKDNNNNFIAEKVEVSEGLNYYALVPEFELSTSKARAVLPQSVAFSDAVSNIGRTALLITALRSGNFEILEDCLDDKLHQPYRSKLIPDFDEILRVCKKVGSYGTYLSGAGPTIMTLVSKENIKFAEQIENYLSTLSNKWQVLKLELDTRGAIVF